ncbi:hypothetical protein ACFPRL_30575 [Pseudoclavibacter helvolus]
MTGRRLRHGETRHTVASGWPRHSRGSPGRPHRAGNRRRSTRWASHPRRTDRTGHRRHWPLGAALARRANRTGHGGVSTVTAVDPVTPRRSLRAWHDRVGTVPPRNSVDAVTARQAALTVNAIASGRTRRANRARGPGSPSMPGRGAGISPTVPDTGPASVMLPSIIP